MNVLLVIMTAMMKQCASTISVASTVCVMTQASLAMEQIVEVSTYYWQAHHSSQYYVYKCLLVAHSNLQMSMNVRMIMEDVNSCASIAMEVSAVTVMPGTQ